MEHALLVPRGSSLKGCEYPLEREIPTKPPGSCRAIPDEISEHVDGIKRVDLTPGGRPVGSPSKAVKTP
jgi:hypothetical protein